MNWQALLNPEIQNFVATHEQDDVSKLALQKPPNPDWPMPLIFEQIKSRQKAAKKIPHWMGVRDIVFPPPDLVEQASSFACASYKASLIDGHSFADLTAGCGIDTDAFARKFDKGFAVEMDDTHFDILAHNLMVSGEDHILVVKADAQEYIKNMPEVDVVYIDPQRRDGKTRGIYALDGCSPNILDMMQTLKTKTRYVLLKTSPVLDIQKTMQDLGHATDVYIVEYQGDCKEVLYQLDLDCETTPDQAAIHAVQINDKGEETARFDFTFETEKNAECNFGPAQKYIYEPSPSLMKSGGFKSIAAHFNLTKLAPNTHLYTAETVIENFPGRSFELEATCAVNKKELKKHLPEMKANLTIRNFPSSTDVLRKKLGLKDGGAQTIFAHEDHLNNKGLIICKKISGQ